MEIVANKDVPSRSIILRYMVVPRYLISRNATRVRIKQGLLRHHDPGPVGSEYATAQMETSPVTPT